MKLAFPPSVEDWTDDHIDPSHLLPTAGMMRARRVIASSLRDAWDEPLVVCGPTGYGKSLLLRSLRDHPPGSCATRMLPFAHVARRHLTAYLAAWLGTPAQAAGQSSEEIVVTLLRPDPRTGRPILLLLDEIQAMSHDCLTRLLDLCREHGAAFVGGGLPGPALDHVLTGRARALRRVPLSQPWSQADAALLLDRTTVGTGVERRRLTDLLDLPSVLAAAAGNPRLVRAEVAARLRKLDLFPTDPHGSSEANGRGTVHELPRPTPSGTATHASQTGAAGSEGGPANGSASAAGSARGATPLAVAPDAHAARSPRRPRWPRRLASVRVLRADAYAGVQRARGLGMTLAALGRSGAASWGRTTARVRIRLGRAGNGLRVAALQGERRACEAIRLAATSSLRGADDLVRTTAGRASGLRRPLRRRLSASLPRLRAAFPVWALPWLTAGAVLVVALPRVASFDWKAEGRKERRETNGAARVAAPGPSTADLATADLGDAELIEASPPSAIARLRVNALPWGSIELDGAAVGSTPLSVEVRAGAYHLRVEMSDGRVLERDVVIPAEGHDVAFR